MTRILLAGLVHRTNAFATGSTRLKDFEVLRGGEMSRNDASSISTVWEIGQGMGWEILPAVCMCSKPGAPVVDAVVDLFWSEFRAVADSEAANGVDGVFLVLHGAMVSESLPDVEGEILRRIRGFEHLSDAPICGVMGSDANFTEAMARQSDGLVAHREYPPTDEAEATELAATILDGLVHTEERPATVREHPPIMWPPSLAATDGGPMLDLERRAREMEAELPEILVLNVLSGFPHADVPEAGVAFSAVTTGDMELARGALRELNVMASASREEGAPRLVALGDAVASLEDHAGGPVLLVEPSDAVEAGAAGDATRVLRALVEQNIPNAGVVINDPETVTILGDVSPGRVCTVEVGGKSGQAGSEPLTLKVEVLSHSDGRFMPERPPGSDVFFTPDGLADMGPCALVRHGDVLVLLTSRRTPPFDLGQWRSQGVEPEGLRAIGVKAAVVHHLAYDPIASASHFVDLTGPSAENLRSLSFENVNRPVYPLDEM